MVGKCQQSWTQVDFGQLCWQLTKVDQLTKLYLGPTLSLGQGWLKLTKPINRNTQCWISLSFCLLSPMGLLKFLWLFEALNNELPLKGKFIALNLNNSWSMLGMPQSGSLLVGFASLWRISLLKCRPPLSKSSIWGGYMYTVVVESYMNETYPVLLYQL